MARQPYFSGNYGSALAQIDTRPIMQGAAAQAAMYQGLGQNIGGAIEKYGLNKQKAETADMMIGAYLENMSPVDRGELEAGTSEIGKTLNKFIDGELTTSKKVAFAGALGVMQTQREKDAKRDLMKAQEEYYRQPRHAPASPEKVAEAEAIKKAMSLFSQPGQGGRGRRGAQAPSGAPGLPGPGTVDVSQLPAVPQQSPPLGGAYPALPPQTGAVGQAMALPPRRKRGGKYKNLSRKEKQLVKFSDQNPAAAAVLDKSVFDGGIEKLRDRTREWGRHEIGVAQEVLDKDGLATDLYLIPTSNNTQLVQSAPEAKPDLYDVKTLEDGSKQQHIGGGKWVELVVDEFETRELAEEKARPLGGKVTYNDKTGGFNVEMSSGFASQMEEITEPAFKAPVFYHRASNKFFTKDAKGKMGEMVDAVTVVGQDKSGDDIVVLNGGSTPYVRNDKGLTQILPSTMRPEARMTFYNQLLAPLQRDPRLIDYMRAKDMSEQDGETEGTGKNRVFSYTDEQGTDRTWKYDQDLEDNIEKMATYMAEMQAVRLAFPLQR